MVAQSSFDVPRIPGTNTAVIGDPRNDENLIVVQFHHAMLRLHNAVVDLLLAAAFAGDIFAEAKRIVTHHYQWAVVHDFLERICGAAAVNDAMASVVAPVGSSFRMPVEFAVAAYRFGHSMIRDTYFVNFNFPTATLGQVFEFNRNPRLPVFSNWVVDFNSLFETGQLGPTPNKARKIDSFMANGLETLPGFTGLMAILATRNLRRGLALGLPSGQGMAKFFGIAPMSSAQLTSGLPAAEVTVLNSNGGLLLKKTPLWYYVLREAAVLSGWQSVGSGRRQDRSGDVRPDAEARRVLLPKRPWRIHAYSSLGHGWRLYGGRSGDLRRRDPALKFGPEEGAKEAGQNRNAWDNRLCSGSATA